MGKAMGATAFIFAVGIGMGSVLEAVFGRYAESATVSFMGFGLLVMGQLLGTKLPARQHGSPSEPTLGMWVWTHPRHRLDVGGVGGPGLDSGELLQPADDVRALRCCADR